MEGKTKYNDSNSLINGADGPVGLELRKIGIGEDFVFYTEKDDGGLSKELIEKKYREPHNSKYLYDFVGSGDVVLDIGANLGYFALLCKKAKKIICIEPIPKAIPILKKNLEINGLKDKCDVVNAIVAKGDEKLLLEVHGSLNSSRITKIKNKNTIEVDNLSLEKLVSKHKANLLRLDVEGYEYDLFLNNVPKRVNKISMEFHSHNMEEKKIKELLNYFEKEGFIVKHLITFFPKRFEKYFLFFKRTFLEKLFVKIFNDLWARDAIGIINGERDNLLIKLYAKYLLKGRRDCYLFLQR